MEISPPLLRKDVTFDSRADVIVVGLGVAGACAAIEAHEAGADVLVIERTSGGGGSSAMAGGYVYFGGGTRVQKANGFDDTVQDMFNYIMAVTPGPDEEKIRLYCENSVAHFDWMERQGVPFNDRFFPGKDPEHATDETLSWTGNEDAWPFNRIAKPVPRGHKIGVNGAAAYAMMNALIATAQRIGVKVAFDSAVNALVVDEVGRVVGVRYRHFDEIRTAEARKGVILTTGGFVWNRAMIDTYTPNMALEGVIPHGAPTSDGAGHQLGLSVGGALTNMAATMISIPIYAPESRVEGILVNKHGQRFINEDTYHGRATAFAMRQPDMIAYLICDAPAFGERNGYEALIDAWETIEEMERDLGIPEGALRATLAKYNADAARGEDPDFHKAAKYLRPLTEPPFAAVNITLGPVSAQGLTQGGLTTTPDAQVLDEAGHVIPGLYAAGATASNIAKDSAGYASGFMIGESSYFGRRAGAHAALSERDAKTA
jgi:succinate dehydrogenase/fumarate reductase flavoprotein subunit